MTTTVTPSGPTYEDATYADSTPSREEARHHPKREFIPDVPIEAGPDYIDAPHYLEFAESSHYAKAVFGNAQASLAQVHTLYNQIEITERVLLDDVPNGAPKVYVRDGDGVGKMITVRGREHEYTNDLMNAYKGVLGRVHEKITQMENVAVELTKQIEDVVKQPSVMPAKNIALASEIRAHMKSLKSADQYDQTVLMQDMIEKGYKEGVLAILDAPPFLSGMTAEEQQEFKQIAQASWAPEATNQLSMTRRLIGIVRHATEELNARYHLSHKRMSNQSVAQVSQRLAELRGLA